MDTNNQYSKINRELEQILNKLILQENITDAIKEMGDTFKIILTMDDLEHIDIKLILLILLMLEEKQLYSTMLNILIKNIKYKILYDYIFNNKNENKCDIKNYDTNMHFDIFKRFEYENGKKFVITFKLYEDQHEEIISRHEVIKPDEKSLEDLFNGFLKTEIEKEKI